MAGGEPAPGGQQPAGGLGRPGARRGAPFFLTGRRSGIADAWRRGRRLIVWEEALFTGAFLVFVGLRLANPDLWQPWFGGEKPMEIAFLNAISKSAHMPPYDPYYAGGAINYYYYGHYLVALLGKLAGLAPEVGFNLAVPTLFGLTLLHAFALGYHLAGTSGARAAGGISAALLVGVMGNLSTLHQVVEGLVGLGRAAVAVDAPLGVGRALGALPAGLARLIRGEGTLPPLEYWYGGTRVIPYTINEFPFFSMLFADLHPHVIALPFGLLVLALLWAWLADPREGALPRPALWAAAALVVGALGPMNTWDVPAYAGLLLAVAAYRGHRRAGVSGLLRGGALGVGVLSAAALLYSPFYAGYTAPELGLGWVGSGARSAPVSYLVVWGTHLFLAFSLVASGAALWRWGRALGRLVARRGAQGTASLLRALYGWRAAWAWLGAGLAALGLLAGAALLVAGEPVLGLLAALLGGSLGALAVAPTAAAALRRLLLAMGSAVLVGVELVYVRDFLDGGEWFRMNTVFKFHFQAWALLSVALGSALPGVWRRIARSGSFARSVWMLAAALLFGVAFAYPVWATPQRVGQRFPGVSAPAWTLDGTAFMEGGVYYWPDATQPIDLTADREAIRWLWEHVPGTPVLAEAPLGYYREGGLRVSSFTGLPTIVGMHANEQRPWEEVARRERDADALFRTTDAAVAWELLGRYRVRYVYVGPLERVAYPDASLIKFERLTDDGRLRRVYATEEVTIYEVVGSGAA